MTCKGCHASTGEQPGDFAQSSDIDASEWHSNPLGIEVHWGLTDCQGVLWKWDPSKLRLDLKWSLSAS